MQRLASHKKLSRGLSDRERQGWKYDVAKQITWVIRGGYLLMRFSQIKSLRTIGV